jgi:O-antigen ligase
VWIGLLILELNPSGLRPPSLDRAGLKKYWWIGVMAIINILVAGNKWVAGYEWVRIIQWGITIKFVIDNKLLVKRYLKLIVPVWIVGESLLGLAQLINNGSLQGMFYWLGERRFSLTTVGIAQMSWLGESIVRAYGTFSHPNSLAGFLLISWLFWQGQNPSALRAAPLDKGATKGIWYWVVWWMGLVGIIISGSRIVWGITALIIISNFKFQISNLKNKFAFGVVVTGAVMMILGIVGQEYKLVDFVGGWDTASLTKRMELNAEAIQMIKAHPLFGVGAGNMVAEEFRYRQPVHNIILLIISELGLIPIILLILNFKFQISKIIMNKNNWVIVGIILITGMVDHYWVTLPQNRWLLAVVIGILG